MRALLTHTPEALAGYYGERALAALEELCEVRLNTGGVLDADGVIEAAQGCDIIVSDRNTPAPAKIFQALPDLLCWLRCAVDIRNVDIEAASANGILVTNASPGFAASVTELVLGMMIDLARRITDHAMAYRGSSVLEPAPGVQLAGSRLGILGYGTIGRQLAEAALALGMDVRVCDPFVDIDDGRIDQCSQDDVLSASDFIVCLVVANDRTEKLMDADAFAAMKHGSFFINVSRGELVDDDALVAALESGHLAGAALDVGRAPDQMPVPGIAGLPNVIATPHIGGLTPQAIKAQSLETVEQVRALAEGRLPHNSVNAASATRLAHLNR